MQLKATHATQQSNTGIKQFANSNAAHLIMIVENVGDELDHAAPAPSAGASKEDDLVLPLPHQLLHSLPARQL